MNGRFLSDNRGMTMTEVLLAFMVLTIVMGLLSGIITFSKRMFVEATDAKRAQETVQKYIYSKEFERVDDAVAVTQYIPVYKVEPERDSDGNDTGIYKINLAVNPNYTGGGSGFESKLTGENSEKRGLGDYNDIKAVTMGQNVCQISISDWVTDERDKEMIKGLDGLRFLLFTKSVWGP